MRRRTAGRESQVAARKRVASRRHWPQNLRQNTQGYYWYQHPVTGKTYGLGKDFEIACDEARTANFDIERRKGHVSLLQRINGGEMTLTAWCDKYAEERAGGNRYTVAAMRSQIKAIKEAAFAVQALPDVTPLEIADFVKLCMAERGDSMAGTIRERLHDLFREATAHGLIPVGKNPVEAILKPTRVVTRARLTLDDYKLILEKAREDRDRRWAANAIELALVCGQRREDVVSMRFDQVKDGFLWIEQTKGKEGNKAKLRIPLGLRLEALGVSLEDVLRRCRDNVATKNVIHFAKNTGRAKPGSTPKAGTMSDVFAQIRDEAKIEVPAGKTPPSFHEIRSLAARLYTEERGAEFAQALLGHKSSSMTALYRDVRGREWTEIKLAAQ